MHRLNGELPETEARCFARAETLFFLFFPLFLFDFKESFDVFRLEKANSTPSPRIRAIRGVLSRRKTKLLVGERYKIAMKSREESRKEKSMAHSRMLPSIALDRRRRRC